MKPKKQNRTQTGKKPSQTEKIKPNRVEPVFVLKNRTETGFGLFFLIRFSYFFFIKTEPNKK
jgi:hypothetical protein